LGHFSNFDKAKKALKFYQVIQGTSRFYLTTASTASAENIMTSWLIIFKSDEASAAEKIIKKGFQLFIQM
jgi:hypothetical protein